MANLVKKLAAKGSQWAVAITTSYFHDEDCENLIQCWDLASIEHANQIDRHFAFVISQMAWLIHPDLVFRPENILLLETNSSETAGFDKMLFLMKYGKTILNLFWLDSRVEVKIRAMSRPVTRLQQIARDVANIARLAEHYEKYAKKNLGRATLFDASACQQQLASANAELAELGNHVQSVIKPVLIF